MDADTDFVEAVEVDGESDDADFVEAVEIDDDEIDDDEIDDDEIEAYSQLQELLQGVFDSLGDKKIRDVVAEQCTDGDHDGSSPWQLLVATATFHKWLSGKAEIDYSRLRITWTPPPRQHGDEEEDPYVGWGNQDDLCHWVKDAVDEIVEQAQTIMPVSDLVPEYGLLAELQKMPRDEFDRWFE